MTEPLVPSTAVIQEPNQTVATANVEILQANSTSAGAIAAIPAPVTTSGTSANVILAASILPAVVPAPGLTITGSPNGIPFAGNMLRVTAFGVNSADANAKTITVNFGASGTLALAVTGSGQNWVVQFWIQNVGTVASPKWWAYGWGQTAATVITVPSANGTDAFSGALTLNLTATAATAGTITVNGCVFEVVR